MSNWIKCSDRLPRINQSVLVVRIGNVANMFLKKDGLWYSDGYGVECLKGFDDITHWQPLPDAPGDEE